MGLRPSFAAIRPPARHACQSTSRTVMVTIGYHWSRLMITDNLAIDIRQLHQFLTIVECGSLGRAAGQLKISEPGLSKSVRRLEDRLEVPLFDRSRRGVALTPYGRVFAER